MHQASLKSPASTTTVADATLGIQTRSLSLQSAKPDEAQPIDDPIVSASDSWPDLSVDDPLPAPEGLQEGGFSVMTGQWSAVHPPQSGLVTENEREINPTPWLPDASDEENHYLNDYLSDIEDSVDEEMLQDWRQSTIPPMLLPWEETAE